MRDIGDNKEKHLRRWVTTGIVLFGPLLLGACAIVPKPMTAAQQAKRARQDYATLARDYVPVKGRLSEAAAMARALKYNYNAALSRMQQTLQQREIDLALTQLLPKLAADAGYDWRSNDNAATSISEITHQQSLEPSYSTERQHVTADLTFSWNLLDVGVSYFQARQQGYRALEAVERRRKVIEGLVKGVQDAYWKAAIAQTLLPRLEPLLAAAQRMLEAQRRTIAARLRPEIQSLNYEENLLEVVTQLQHMRTDLLAARTRLATLIGVPPNAHFTLDPPPRLTLHRPSHFDMTALELTALDMRPELRESAYQEKVERQDIYKEIIKMMPGIGILGDLNYDSDRLLYNHTWAAFGLRATFNLMGLIQGPQAIRAAEAAVNVSKARRLALGVAVLTQCNLGYQEYLSALQDLKTADQVDAIEHQIERASANAIAAEAQSRADRVRYQLATMVADYNRARAEGEAYDALANIYVAAGIDLVPPDVNLNHLGTLTKEVAVSLRRWQEGKLPQPVISTPQEAKATVKPTEIAASH